MADSAKNWMNANWSKWLKSGFPSLEEAFQAGVESVVDQLREASMRAAERIFYSFDDTLHSQDLPLAGELIFKEIEASLSLQGRKQEK